MNILLLSADIIGKRTRLTLDNLYNKIWENNFNGWVDIVDLREYELEFCDGRDYMLYNSDMVLIINRIIKADTIIISTPIYQASIPGTLKNLLDILPEHALRDKKVGIIGIAGTTKHYLAIENHLKPILNFMKADVINKYVFVDRGENKDLDERLNNLVGSILYD